MTQSVEMTHGKLTEEAINKLAASFGKIYRPRNGAVEVHKDRILRFVNGIGDRNPLYRNEEFARRTGYGDTIAPPLFLYAVFAPQGMEGLPGVHAFYCAAEWEWFQVVRLGDIISGEDVPTGLIEKQGRMGGHQYLQTGVVTYYNQRGEIVARCKRGTMRVERTAAKEKGKYSEIKAHKVTDEELERIFEAYDKEEIRGAQPRYWEDVQEGEEFGPMVKGPLTQSDMNAFSAGMGTGGGAHALHWDYLRRHPAWGYTNPETGVPEPMGSGVHGDNRVSSEIGVPVAYDLGVQRFSWCGNLLTNWMGDDGFLKKLDAQCRLFNMFGDTQWFYGRVIRKYVEDDEYLVDCDIWAKNQRDENTTPGHATVRLLSRNRWL